MKDKMLNMDLLIEQSKHKDGLYKSNILQEVSLTKQEIDELRSEKKSKYKLNDTYSFIHPNNFVNIYEDTENRKFYVMKGDKPYTSKSESIYVPRDIIDIPIIFHPVILAMNGMVLMPFLFGLAAAGGGLAAIGIVAAGAATATGVGMYMSKVSSMHSDEIKEKIINKIENKNNEIDINSVFSDPYLDSFSVLANQKSETNEYLVPEDVRRDIIIFEIKKEELSKGIKELTEIYEVLKSNPNTTKDDLVNIENEFKILFSNFNKEKHELLRNISSEIEHLKLYSSEKFKNTNLMTHTDFKREYEIAQLNSMITLNNDSSFENINKAYGKDEISRIEGHVHLLSLALSTKTIEGNTVIKEMVYNISNKMKNFSELSLEEKKEVINNYGLLSDKLNIYFNNFDIKSSINPKDYINKDYINKETISKLIEKIEKNELNLERNI